MSRVRLLAMLAATAVAGGVVAVFNMLPASAATCAPAWQSAAVYTGGATVSHNGKNFLAKWWTQNEAPPGNTGVWQDQGVCGGSTPCWPSPCRTGSSRPQAASSEAVRVGWSTEWGSRANAHPRSEAPRPAPGRTLQLVLCPPRYPAPRM